MIYLFLFLYILPLPVSAQTSSATTYVGNYELVETEGKPDREVVRLAGSLGKVVKSRTLNSFGVWSEWQYHYYSTDAQGSTRQEVSEKNLADNQYPEPIIYYPYGSPVDAAFRATSQQIEDTYTGQKKDEETGLMYYNARYYNPSTGVFIQADSVDDGLNKYQYVGGNPVNRVDPSGNLSVSADRVNTSAPSIGATCGLGGATVSDNCGLMYFPEDTPSELENNIMKAIGIGIPFTAGGFAAVIAAPAVFATAGSTVLGAAASPWGQRMMLALELVDTAVTAYDCVTGTTGDCGAALAMSAGPGIGGSTARKFTDGSNVMGLHTSKYQSSSLKQTLIIDPKRDKGLNSLIAPIIAELTSRGGNRSYSAGTTSELVGQWINSNWEYSARNARSVVEARDGIYGKGWIFGGGQAHLSEFFQSTACPASACRERAFLQAYIVNEINPQHNAVVEVGDLAGRGRHAWTRVGNQIFDPSSGFGSSAVWAPTYYNDMDVITTSIQTYR